MKTVREAQLANLLKDMARVKEETTAYNYEGIAPANEAYVAVENFLRAIPDNRRLPTRIWANDDSCLNLDWESWPMVLCLGFCGQKMYVMATDIQIGTLPYSGGEIVPVVTALIPFYEKGERT